MDVSKTPAERVLLQILAQSRFFLVRNEESTIALLQSLPGVLLTTLAYEKFTSNFFAPFVMIPESSPKQPSPLRTEVVKAYVGKPRLLLDRALQEPLVSYAAEFFDPT